MVNKLIEKARSEGYEGIVILGKKDDLTLTLGGTFGTEETIVKYLGALIYKIAENQIGSKDDEALAEICSRGVASWRSEQVLEIGFENLRNMKKVVESVKKCYTALKDAKNLDGAVIKVDTSSFKLAEYEIFKKSLKQITKNEWKLSFDKNSETCKITAKRKGE